MSLRKTTLLAILATTIGLISVILLSLRSILIPYFKSEQNQNLYLDLQRGERAIANEYIPLNQFAYDWTSWEDISEFIQGSNPDFERYHLQFSRFQESKINLILLFSPQKELVFSKFIDLSSGNELDIPENLSEVIESESIFPSLPEDVFQGLVNIQGEPLLFVSKPIKSPKSSSDLIDGYLIVGKILSRQEISSISTSIHIPLHIIPASEGQSSDASLILQAVLQNPPYYTTEINNQEVEGYALLKDAFDKPAFLIQIEQTPTIYKNGTLLINSLISALIMSGITFSTLLFLLLEGNVLARLRGLTQAVTKIGTSGDISSRLLVTRNDELSHLGQTINEMLNALQQSQKNLEISEERFRTLVESMDDIVFTVNADLSEIQVFGQPGIEVDWLEKLVNTNSGTGHLSSETQQIIQKHHENIHNALSGEHITFEWTSLNGEETENYSTSLSPITNKTGNITGVVGVGRKITQLKRLEENLRHRFTELEALYEVSKVFLSRLDPTATYTGICRLAVEYFDVETAWIAGVNQYSSGLSPLACYGCESEILDSLPLSFQNDPPRHIAVEVFNQGEFQIFNQNKYTSADWEKKYRSAISFPLQYGEYLLGALTLYQTAPDWFNENRIRLLQAFANLAGMALQNTNLFQQVSSGRERLQQLSKRLVEVQEEERRNIALELHDEIGQILTGLKFTLDIAQSLPPEQAITRITQALEIVNQLISRVREMSLNLRPSMLDDLGLLPTIIWFLDNYTKQTNIEVNLQHTDIKGRRFRTDIETTGFRLVQEALTNVARHAGVKNVNVRLWVAGNILGIQIEDQGAGFDVDEALTSRKSRGLIGMRERVGVMGGILQIDAQPGEGCCLTAEIPYEGYMERRRNVRIHPLGR